VDWRRNGTLDIAFNSRETICWNADEGARTMTETACGEDVR
jgi:hypothetical protein